MTVPELIESQIFLVRGQKVMFDFMLAKLYGVTTKALKQQVKRNAFRFPRDFAFSLSSQEVAALRSQFVTSNAGRGGRRASPLVFTVQGVAMLSSVLNSRRAVEVNIHIVRTFVKLRAVSISNQELRKQIEELEAKCEGRFRLVFEALKDLGSLRSIPRKRIVGLEPKK
jgi:hypothetical protein